MSREIKFRMWNKSKKRMFNNNQIDLFPRYFCNYDHLVFMQYTGLKDKNDKEIYEGDIVKRHGYTDYNYCFNVSEIIGTVVYEDCGFVVKHFDKDNKEIKYTTPFFIELSEYHEAIKHYEVIGNIYENPELLESEANNE